MNVLCSFFYLDLLNSFILVAFESLTERRTKQIEKAKSMVTSAVDRTDGTLFRAKPTELRTYNGMVCRRCSADHGLCGTYGHMGYGIAACHAAAAGCDAAEPSTAALLRRATLLCGAAQNDAAYQSSWFRRVHGSAESILRFAMPLSAASFCCAKFYQFSKKANVGC
jgi:hypothetical protein